MPTWPRSPRSRGWPALRLPKVESPATVVAAAARDPGRGRCTRSSSPRAGVEAAFAIATAHPAVAAIGLGEADLRSDLGVTDDDGLAWARGRIVVAARAAGLPPPAMSVYADLSRPGRAGRHLRGRPAARLPRPHGHPPAAAAGDRRAAFRPAARGGGPRPDCSPRRRRRGRGLGDALVLPDGRFADRAMVAAARRIVDLAARYAG